MRFTRVAKWGALLLLGPVTAQSLSGLPTCAQPAFDAALQASGCTTKTCICNNIDLIPSVLRAIETACDPPDQAAVESFAETYCGTATVESLLSAASLTTITSSTGILNLPSASPTTNSTSASTSNATISLTSTPDPFVSSSSGNITLSRSANATLTHPSTTSTTSTKTTRAAATQTATKTASLASRELSHPISGALGVGAIVTIVAIMSWIFAEL